MTVKAIVGAQLGDEGKGKMVDIFAQDADMVIRAWGGGNAGHTIHNEYGKTVLHLMPSGVFNPNCLNVIAPGVAFDPEQFFIEYDELVSKGVTPKVMISDRCQVLLAYHKELNVIEERRLGKHSFGSTCKGITQFYSDLINKIGIKIDELWLDDEDLLAKLHRAYSTKLALLKYYHEVEKSAHELSLLTHPNLILKQIKSYRDRLKPFLGDVSKTINDAIEEGKEILLEGQLGALRDPLHGIYPHVSGISTLPSYFPVSCGFSPMDMHLIISVMKSYATYVGSGDFPTELHDDEAHELREINHEYGATSGRPRRVGWFDIPMTKYGLRLNGATDVILSLLDVLGHYDTIPVCTSYYDTRDGKIVNDFPLTSELKYMKPVYVNMPGWKEDISECKHWNELPKKCKEYILFVQKQIGVKIHYVSVGKDREQFIDIYNNPILINDLKLVCDGKSLKYTKEHIDKVLS